jgi:hypothetical protein
MVTPPHNELVVRLPGVRHSPISLIGKGAAKSRWMVWSGQPFLVDEPRFKPTHGLINQSLHSRMGVGTTNGDRFGLGWYRGPGCRALRVSQPGAM